MSTLGPAPATRDVDFLRGAGLRSEASAAVQRRGPGSSGLRFQHRGRFLLDVSPGGETLYAETDQQSAWRVTVPPTVSEPEARATPTPTRNTGGTVHTEAVGAVGAPDGFLWYDDLRFVFIFTKSAFNVLKVQVFKTYFCEPLFPLNIAL